MDIQKSHSNNDKSVFRDSEAKPLLFAKCFLPLWRMQSRDFLHCLKLSTDNGRG